MHSRRTSMRYRPPPTSCFPSSPLCTARIRWCAVVVSQKTRRGGKRAVGRSPPQKVPKYRPAAKKKASSSHRRGRMWMAAYRMPRMALGVPTRVAPLLAHVRQWTPTGVYPLLQESTLTRGATRRETREGNWPHPCPWPRRRRLVFLLLALPRSRKASPETHTPLPPRICFLPSRFPPASTPHCPRQPPRRRPTALAHSHFLPPPPQSSHGRLLGPPPRHRREVPMRLPTTTHLFRLRRGMAVCCFYHRPFWCPVCLRWTPLPHRIRRAHTNVPFPSPPSTKKAKMKMTTTMGGEWSLRILSFRFLLVTSLRAFLFCLRLRHPSRMPHGSCIPIDFPLPGLSHRFDGTRRCCGGPMDGWKTVRCGCHAYQ